MSKPTRAYTVELGPTIIGVGEGRYEVIEPGMKQIIHGHKVDYKQFGDTLFLQIKTHDGDILYSAPAHTIKYVWTPTAQTVAPVVSIVKGE